MTLILGAHCTDGVVISGDRKIVDLATRNIIGYSTKLFGALRNVNNIPGSEDMFHVFLRYIVGDLVILRDDATDIQITICFKNLVTLCIF